MKFTDVFKADYQKVILNSGAKLYYFKNTGKRLCVVKVLLGCGTIFETPANSGLSHFLEHMMFQGNKKLGDNFALNHIFESLPGDLSAATGFEQTEFYYSFPVSEFKQGIQNFCRLLFYPSFTNFDKEKSVILEELKADLNDSMQFTNVYDIADSIMWPEQALGLPIGGSLQSVENLDKKKLISYYQTHYHPKNMIFSVVGDLELSEVIAAFNHDIPKLRRPYLKPARKKFILLKNTPKRVQWVTTKSSLLEFLWSFPIDKLSAEEILLADILDSLLDDGFSSLLPRKIREDKGLAYEISSCIFQYQNTAVLSIYTQISPAKLLEFSQALTHLVTSLIKKGFADWELQLHKKRRQAELFCLLDFPQSYLSRVIDSDLYPKRSLKKYWQTLSVVDIESINQLTRKFLDNRSTVLVLTGADKKIATKKFLELYANWLPKNYSDF